MVHHKKLHVVLNNRGQSAVEYILLLSVIVAMVLVVFRSTVFKSLFGNESKIFEAYKRSIEFTYQNGYNDRKPIIYQDNRRYTLPHPSYLAPSNQTRFFYTQKYPGGDGG